MEVRQPLPATSWFRAGADWNLLQTFDDEPILEREEEQLHRRSRRVRTLIEEEEVVDDSQLRMEKKRKGKELAQPSPKRTRPVNQGIFIWEADQAVPSLPCDNDEGSETGEPELRWTRTSKRSMERRPELESVNYSKQSVVLTANLLKRMLEFDNLKWQEEVNQRVTKQKRLKSGKKIHQPTLEKIEVEEKFTEYITGIGFEWLLDIDATPIPEALAKEFFTSFRFTGGTNLDARSITFRVFGRPQQMCLNEFSISMRLYNNDQVANGEWFGRDIGLPSKKADFDQQAVWQVISHDRTPAFKASKSRGNYIADPALRLAQVYLGCNLLGQANTTAMITLAELYFMWCMTEQRKVHLGFWLAYSINQIATRPARHLNVCHLLGAYLKRNWNLENQESFRHPIRCPPPELFDIDYFFRIQVLENGRHGRFHFYILGQHEHSRGQLETRQRPTERPASPSKHQRSQLAIVATPRVKQTEEAAQKNADWKLRIEQMMAQLVENSQAHLVQTTRIGNVMERLLESVRDPASSLARPTSARHPPHPSTRSPQARHATAPTKPTSTQAAQPPRKK